MYQGTTILCIVMNVSCTNGHSLSQVGFAGMEPETRILVHRIYWGSALRKRQ